MNVRRGFIQMPPVNLGISFPGIGILPRLKLGPKIARKMLLEAHRWTGQEAFAEGIVDAIAEPSEMESVAVEYAEIVCGKASMGVWGEVRIPFLAATLFPLHINITKPSADPSHS
jgi:Delta3-Delta2-enoyl-CoA isomerase